MAGPESGTARPARLGRYALAVAALWSVVVGASLAWNVYQLERRELALARIQAEMAFEKDVVMRAWAAEKGGVYAPVARNTPPNPYLDHVPERDITTPSGVALTLVNPAYMTRQVHERMRREGGVRGHITSLDPVRPENAPDAWEAEALRAFTRGEEVVAEIGAVDGAPYFRLMKPLYAKKSCLKCHARHGYQEGDLRGGLSVAVPMRPLQESSAAATGRLALTHVGLWLVGLAGIGWGGRRLARSERRRDAAEAATKRALAEVERRVEERTEQLRESEARFHGIAASTHDAVVVLDDAAKVIFWNRAAETMFGYAAEEVVGREGHRHFMPEAQRAAYLKGYEGFRRSGEGTIVGRTVEMEGERRDGTRFPVELTVSPLRIKGRWHAVGVIRDVTRRKEQERALRDARRHLHDIVDSMPSALVGVDGECRVTHWNREAARLTGVAETEALGRPVGEVAPLLADEAARARRALRERRPLPGPRRPVESGGTRRYVETMVYPLTTEEGTGAVIRIDDVTERVRVEEVMVQTEKMMSVGGLAAGMAHEINNPLAAMLQGVQNLERRLSPDLKRNREVAARHGVDLAAVGAYMEERGIPGFLRGVRDSGERAAEIVANLLHFSRPHEERREPVDVGELVERSVTLAGMDYDMKKRHGFRDFEIVREIEPGLPPVPCIADDVEQVLLNLLRNAAEAIHAQGERAESPRITLRAYRRGGMVYVEVADNGPGMDEQTRKRVFEPFFTTRPPAEGTGLGLSVAHALVADVHGGTIDVASTPGEGSTFTIGLPLTEDET